VSDQEREPGGPNYGGDRGGGSAGGEGGQGGRGGAEPDSEGKQVEEHGAQSGDVGGRSTTEREGEATAKPSPQGSTSNADRAKAIESEQEESGQELPG
jgi:hypothetical protein